MERNMKEELLLTILLLMIRLAFTSSWQEGAHIKSQLKRDDLAGTITFKKFDVDFLKLLHSSPQRLVVGGKNSIYVLSPDDLSVVTTLNWSASQEDQEVCQIKGQEESKCHNYITLFHGPLKGRDQGYYLVCGTNAFKPKCRKYTTDLKSYIEEFSGIGYTPFDPETPATSVLHGGNVYSATSADFSGTDYLIYKKPLRTEQYFDKQLNVPNFISSHSYKQFSLFFFREYSLEHAHCGKRIFSRVARICGGDVGSRKHKDRFASFLKARLNCSIGGDFPFYFDHLRGTSRIMVKDGTLEEIIYGAFSTPPNSIGASAVCAFRVKDVMKVFNGRFKGQETLTSNWLPVSENKVPSNPRPGTCSSTTSSSSSSSSSSHHPNSTGIPLDSNSFAFIREHALMDEAVTGTPILVHPSNQYTFTSMEIDDSVDVRPYQIIYLGTDAGMVLKAVVNRTESSLSLSSLQWDETVISQSWMIFSSWEPILSLQLVDLNKKLFVLTRKEGVLIPVRNCNNFISSCADCVRIRDPHCGWDPSSKTCINVAGNGLKSQLLVQDVKSGHSDHCPFVQTIDEADRKKEDDCCPDKNGSGTSSVNVTNSEQFDELNDNENKVVKQRNNDEAQQDKENFRVEDVDNAKRTDGSFGGQGEPHEFTSSTSSTNTTSNNYLISNGGNGRRKNNSFDVFNEIPGASSVSGRSNVQETDRSNHIHPSSNRFLEEPRHSFVKKGSGMSTQSVILATVSSAVLCLLLGFTLGFISYKKILSNKNSKVNNNLNSSITSCNGASSNVPDVASSISIPTLKSVSGPTADVINFNTKTIDYVVNLGSFDKSSSSFKNNNVNTDTYGRTKTPKKIYL